MQFLSGFLAQFRCGILFFWVRTSFILASNNEGNSFLSLSFSAIPTSNCFLWGEEGMLTFVMLCFLPCFFLHPEVLQRPKSIFYTEAMLRKGGGGTADFQGTALLSRGTVSRQPASPA